MPLLIQLQFIGCLLCARDCSKHFIAEPLFLSLLLSSVNDFFLHFHHHYNSQLVAAASPSEKRLFFFLKTFVCERRNECVFSLPSSLKKVKSSFIFSLRCLFNSFLLHRSFPPPKWGNLIAFVCLVGCFVFVFCFVSLFFQISISLHKDLL